METEKIKCLVAVTALMLWSVGNAHAADRIASLINSFQVLCTLEAPVFEWIDQKAMAMNLPVRQDIGQSKDSGAFVHSKSWLVTLTTGPHELLAAEANGPQGYIKSCGISAPDPNGESFKHELVSIMKLGPPSSETITQDGVMRVTEWKDAFGAGTLLRLVDATPKNKPGAMLFHSVHEATKP
jgi:hypothetical protein